MKNDEWETENIEKEEGAQRDLRDFPQWRQETRVREQDDRRRTGRLPGGGGWVGWEVNRALV